MLGMDVAGNGFDSRCLHLIDATMRSVSRRTPENCPLEARFAEGG